MCAAAKDLQALLRCRSVLLKGGHMVNLQDNSTGSSGAGSSKQDNKTGDADTRYDSDGWGGGMVATDVFYDGLEMHVMEQPVVLTSNTHGTGVSVCGFVSVCGCCLGGKGGGRCVCAVRCGAGGVTGHGLLVQCGGLAGVLALMTWRVVAA
jgi:hydroxymethylpyrimidine/phosphomethylpyrimidine kinase